MQLNNSATTNTNRNRPALLTFCVLFSILLHLLVIFLLPYLKTAPDMTTTSQQPTVVRLVDKPSTEQKMEYELDQQPKQVETEAPPKSTRLAEQNQQTEKEMAPKGDDVRDQAKQPAIKQPSLAVKAQPPAANRPAQQQAMTQNTTKSKLPRKQEGKFTAPAPQQSASSTKQPEAAPTPSLEQLTQLTPNTLNRLAQASQSDRERIKQREDMETGDTVWLNLKRGDLISFFRRFSNQVEWVWNYPQQAIVNEMQGTLLLKVTIDRTGELVDVELIRGSNYELLDSTAIQAIFAAGPFGPLPKHYPHPDLKFYAHFQYTLSGKYIYGEGR